MAQILLEYNPRNAIAKKTLEYVLSIGAFKKIAPKNAIEISLEEARKGEVTRHKSVKDYFKKIAK